MISRKSIQHTGRADGRAKSAIPERGDYNFLRKMQVLQNHQTVNRIKREASQASMEEFMAAPVAAKVEQGCRGCGAGLVGQHGLCLSCEHAICAHGVSIKEAADFECESCRKPNRFPVPGAIK